MWPVSTTFLATVAATHRITSTVTVHPAGAAAEQIAGVVTAGQVTVDAARGQRRSCEVTIVDPDLIWTPSTARDILSPASGNELTIERGVIYDDDTTEMVPLGVFRIIKTQVKETAEGVSMTVTGVDRSWLPTRAQWTRPWAITAGTTVEHAIRDALLDRTHSIVMDFPTTGYTVPQMSFGLGAEESTDPWTACQDLAADAGYDLYFDAQGVCVMVPSPSPTDTPVIAYGPDDAHVVIDAERLWDGDQVFNGVVVTAESTNLPAPLRAEAWDMNVDSPTYRYGPFGEIADIYSSSTILTQSQAQDAANERLRRRLGQGAEVSWTQVVNPALEAGDVVRFTSTNLGVAANVLLDSVTIPLAAEASAAAAGRTVLAVEQ